MPEQGRSLDASLRTAARRWIPWLAVGAGLFLVAVVLVGRAWGTNAVVVTLGATAVLLQAATLAAVCLIALVVRSERRERRTLASLVDRRTRRIVQQGRRARLRDERLAAGIADARVHAQQRHLATQRQVQALLNLDRLVRPEAAVPPAGGWAASPDLILFCVDVLLSDRPRLVVECGSGISTLYLALAAEQHGLDTRVVALEHQEVYAEQTRAMLDRHGVGHRVEVRLAPLARTSIPDHDTPWYAESAIEDLDDIGMLLVDGPPTATGPLVRYPAVPLLRARFAQRCIIVMDDLVRESDLETARLWSALLDDFELSVSRDFEKHAGILRRS